MKTPIATWHRFAVSVFFFCCGCIFATWASRIPSVIEKFSFNEAQLGAVLFMLPLGSLVALPVAGWASSVFSSRWLTFLSTIGYGVLLLVIGYTEKVWALSAGLFFFGFWGNALNISVNIQALQVQEEYYQKSLMASFHGMWSLGALTGAFTGGLSMKYLWSLAGHFTLVSILLSVLAILFFFYLIPFDKPRNPDHKLFALPDKGLWILGAICFCCALCEGAMADWSSLYYKQVINNVRQISTTGYTSFALCMAGGRFIGDRIADHMGYKGILVLDSFLISAGLSLALFFPSPITVIIGFGLVGFGVSTIIPMVYSVAGRSQNLSPGTALAAVSSVGFTGFLIGPPLIGFLAHQFSLRWALLLVLVLGLLITPLSGRVEEKR
jgi:MFS family permease